MSIPVPEYMRIRQYVMNRIHKLTEPEKLPSEREMCEMFSVCRKTVRRAFADLIKEGYIISKPRSGNFAKPMREFIDGKTIGILFGAGMNIRYSRQSLIILSSVCDGLSNRFATGEILNISSIDNMIEELSLLNLDGLLWVNASQDNLKFHKKMQKKINYPMILMSYYEAPEEGNYIINKFTDTGTQIADYFVKLGHEKILYVGYDPASSGSRMALTGFKNALKNHNISIEKKLILRDSNIIESKLKTLFNQRPLPFSALFCRSIYCQLIYDLAAQKGLSIPEDFSLITEEDEFSLQLEINPTRMRRPVSKMAFEAINKLLDIIENKITEPVQKTFKWEIHEGDSCCRLI